MRAGGCAAAAEEETSSGFDSSDITGVCSFSPFFFRLSLFFLFFTSEFFFCRNSSVYPGARVERVGVG